MKTLAFCRVLWYNVCMENREMQTSNPEEMVTISRAEYERFQEQAQVITSLTLQKEAVRSFLRAGGADGHGAVEPDLQ